MKRVLFFILIAAAFAPVYGWRAAFFISVIPALLVLFIRRHMPESDMWEKSRHKENRLKILLSPAIRRLFLFALILTIFDMCAYWFTYSWLPTYLHRERSFSLARSGLFMLVTQAGGFLGYATFGHVADRFGRRPAYTVYSAIMAIGLLMITIFWGTIASINHLILLFMFIVGFGTGMFGGYGPLFSEIFPTAIRNTAMGAAFNLARGVQFFTPIGITAHSPAVVIARKDFPAQSLKEFVAALREKGVI